MVKSNTLAPFQVSIISQRIINMPAKTGIKGYGKGRAKLGSKKRKARRKKG